MTEAGARLASAAGRGAPRRRARPPAYCANAPMVSFGPSLRRLACWCGSYW
ncbi:uncharacterized protein SOCE836_011800 [Sorangium cellulosum]|uniref:Uncharacterized protein n=1 Tax=Sorangium cellulosum TaxID=56 RepID=A0A4P2QIB8_SORCE|nr:uncharacterized protein SOCE836_011800 [Sorangium cellulosum]WCQ88484.1 hypothetical protein NQZ70_01161 [Sorangium sp. Soce836]